MFDDDDDDDDEFGELLTIGGLHTESVAVAPIVAELELRDVAVVVEDDEADDVSDIDEENDEDADEGVIIIEWLR